MSQKTYERAFINEMKVIGALGVKPTYDDAGVPSQNGLQEAIRTNETIRELISALAQENEVVGNDILHRALMAPIWKDYGKPIFQITPELAAALILSDLPKELADPPPFPAFLISLGVMPDSPTPLVINGTDYYGAAFLEQKDCWCLWAFPRWSNDHSHYEKTPQGTTIIEWAKKHPASVHFHRLITNFIAYVSAKQAAQELPPFKKVKLGARKGQNLCSLGRAVQLPHNLVYAARGETSADPQQKLLRRHVVRGHWRNQPVGRRGGGKTKLIWIQPHWKGPDIVEATERIYRVT